MNLLAGLVALALALPVFSAPTAASGYVKTSGTGFTLNGAAFSVVGSNSYWVGLTGLSTTYVSINDVLASHLTFGPVI